MYYLERKIPPLFLFIIFLAGMTIYSRNFEYITYSISLFTFIGALVIAIGVLILLNGVYLFKINNTSVNPISSKENTRLVTSGFYKFSRNPMYLGFFLVLFGYGLLCGNESITFSLLFGIYLNEFQIKPEEKELDEIFGEEYSKYKKNVGRWFSFSLN